MNQAFFVETLKPAGLWRRGFCLFYDFFIVVALWFVAAAVVLWIRQEPMPAQQGMWFRLYLLGVMGAYFVLCWRYGGQTIGMKAWKVKLINDLGGDVSFFNAMVRFCLGFVSVLLFGVGFFWALFHVEKKTLYDIASRSQPVLLVKKNSEMKV